MASRLRTTDHNKTPGSKRICQERFSCNGSKAEFDCFDCGTRQCIECEKRLHASNPRFTDHDRVKIWQAKFPDSVQQCGMWCNPVNPAVFSCIECQGVLCEECNIIIHRGKLTKHHRRPIVVSKKSDGDGSGVNTKELTSDPSPITTDEKFEPGYLAKFEVPLLDVKKSSFTDDQFQSAIGLNSLSALPVLEKLEKPPEFNINLTGEHSDKLTDFLMNEISSNEFHSLEEQLETSMMGEKSQTYDLTDDMDRFASSEEPSALSFTSGHFTSQSSSQDHQPVGTTSKSGSKKPMAAPRQPSTIQPTHAAAPMPISVQNVPPSVPKEISNRPAQPIVDHTIGGSNPKRKVAVSLSNSGRESNLVKPVASVMGTSQNSISSNEGDSDHHIESPQGSISRKQINVPGILREDIGAARHHAMSKEPAFKYTPGFLLVDENENLQVLNPNHPKSIKILQVALFEKN